MGEGELVMRTMSKLWKNAYSKLGEVNIKKPLDNALIKQTMRPWEYRMRAKEIVKELKAKSPFLELGCGYGGLAHEILKIKDVSYIVVDNKPMLVQAKKLLKNKVTYVDAKNIKTLRNKKFGLFISFHCLSETPFEYRCYVLEYIIRNCRKVCIMDLEDKQVPTARMEREGWEMLPAITEFFLNKFFVINKRRFCRHRGNFLYTGERRK